ncbi:hypothetical protein ACPYO6_08430 [Georgenia sp. Z1344]|uniref:hypothetical protein n=1 Tax=Georgenia sp. Z1344 TaxID=3416706 RepID=UPI003CFAAAC9
MSDAGVAQYLDEAAESVLAGDGLVLDERDPDVPLPLRDLWGFYRALAVDRPWILRGAVAAELWGASLLLRKRSFGARSAGVLLLADAVGELFLQAYARRHTDEDGRLVLPPRPRDTSA